jgi:hypothetical protein
MYIVAFQKIIDILWFVQINLGPFRLSVQRIIYSLIPIVGLVVILNERRKKNISIQIPILKVFILIFSILFFFNILRSPLSGEYYSEAIERLIKILSGFTFFWIGWYYFDTEKKYDPFAKLFIFTYLISFLGIFLQLTGIFTLANIGVAQQTASQTGAEEILGTESTTRYAGFYNDGGTQAMYLYTAIPLCLYFIYKNEQRKWLYYFMLIVCFSGLILSFVRGTWLIMVIILFGWLLINKEFGKITAIVITAVGLFLGGTFLGRFFKGFFRDIFASIEAGKLVGISGKAVRIEIIQDKFEQLPFSSKLFGEGVGANNLAIASVTGHEFDALETDFYGYLYDLGILGWIFYYSIPTVALLLVLKNILRCNPKVFGYALNLKYKISFAMLIGSFFTYFGSGSKWVSFTFPLFFLLGFALKPPEFYLLKKMEEENIFYITPKLELEHN